jgi:trans-2,3-dihydro-3-hydroxyanthranilate isomerase
VAAVGGTGISVVHWDGAVARSRVFAGGAGVAEDPATGSAALALGVYLAGSLGDGEHGYVVEQGHEMGRPSTLSCTVTVTAGAAVRTTVSGLVVPVSRGEIAVP